MPSCPALITAARKHVETYTKRALINQTWDYWLDHFPGGTMPSRGWWDGVREGALSELVQAQGIIRLPMGRLNALTAITWYDTTDSPNTLDLSTLVVQNEIEPPALFPKIGQIWPVTTRPWQAVQIRYVAGYGAAAANVPGDIIQAIKLLVSHFYDNHDVLIEGRMAETPFSVRALLDGYRMLRLK
jgi:hypothetical protein